MRVTTRLGRAAGWLAVAAMVLLASPGLRVVRAETPASRAAVPGVPSGSAADGPMCPLVDVEARAAHRAGVAAQVAARLRAEFADAEDARPLNGRGYGYNVQPDPWRELQQLEAEAALQRAAR